MSEEINPYQPPQSAASSMALALPRNRRAGCLRGSLGCGCLAPLVLFVIALLSGDVGGPLFWPIFVIFGMFTGAVIGTVFAPRQKRND